MKDNFKNASNAFDAKRSAKKEFFRKAFGDPKTASWRNGDLRWVASQTYTGKIDFETWWNVFTGQTNGWYAVLVLEFDSDAVSVEFEKQWKEKNSSM